MKLREIAAAANVSLTTVSLVLNGKRGVSPAKRELITRLLLENGYLPASESATIGSGKSICFIRCLKHGHLINGNPGFTTQILDAAENECRRQGYSLRVVSLQKQETGDCAISNHLRADDIRGAIVLATEMSDEDARVLYNLQKPIVVVDHLLPGADLCCITMNNRDSILEAVQHLRDLGHENVGMLCSSLPNFNDKHRRMAYENALKVLGLPRGDLFYSAFPTLDGAYRSVKDHLARGVRFPTALIASNDCVAIGAMRAFREAGLRVPEDISIIGFDGLPFSEAADPPLTTVSVPCGDIGRLAVDVLLSILNETLPTNIKIMANTKFVIRRSTASPAQANLRHPNLL